MGSYGRACGRWWSLGDDGRGGKGVWGCLACGHAAVGEPKSCISGKTPESHLGGKRNLTSGPWGRRASGADTVPQVGLREAPSREDVPAGGQCARSCGPFPGTGAVSAPTGMRFQDSDVQGWTCKMIQLVLLLPENICK